MIRILIIEDDKNARRLQEAVLKTYGYNTISACNGIEGLEILDKVKVDMIIVDAMMPGMDGFQFTEILRSTKNETPIIMVTAMSDIINKKKGFISGVDDYMTKPIDEEELILRIKAILRRAKIVEDHQLTVGDIVLNYDMLTVDTGRETIALPQKEFYLLFKLMSYPNKIFTRRQLMDEIWNMDTKSDERTVDVHINRLRERFKAYDNFAIVTVRGLGYKVVIK